MASQPANTSIEVKRRIRAQRNDLLHTSVKHRASGIGFVDLVMNVPGEEILVFEIRDESFRTDAFRFGHPVTVVPRTLLSFEDAVELLTDMDFPVTFPNYPRDKFLNKASGSLTDDLHQELRDLAPAPRGLFQVAA